MVMKLNGGIHWMRKIAFVACCPLAPAIVGNEIYLRGYRYLYGITED